MDSFQLSDLVGKKFSMGFHLYDFKNCEKNSDLYFTIKGKPLIFIDRFGRHYDYKTVGTVVKFNDIDWREGYLEKQEFSEEIKCTMKCHITYPHKYDVEEIMTEYLICNREDSTPILTITMGNSWSWKYHVDASYFGIENDSENGKSFFEQLLDSSSE